MTLKISIIIPVYNAAQYLEECLLSISQQSFTDFEILAVNDGSSDRSLEILKKYQEKEPRLKVFSQVNKGVSAARNVGIEKAQGDYLTFVDADDWLLKEDWLLCFVEKARHSSAEIVCAGFTSCAAQNKLIREELPFPTGIYQHQDIRNTILPYFFQKDGLNAIFTKMYSRKLITENKILFPENFIIAEDHYFNVQAFLVANAVELIDSYGYAYREVQGSATKNVLKNNYLNTTNQVYHFDYSSVINGWLDREELQKLKQDKYVKAILSLIYIYINPENHLNFTSRWRRVNEIVNDDTVINVFKKYSFTPQNRFENLNFKAIKNKCVICLFLYNYYSYLRNKN